MLRLDGDMDELFMFAQQLTVLIGSFRLVRDDGNNSGKLPDTDLPNVKIRYDGIAVALDRLANFIRQVGSRWCAIEQDTTGVANKAVSPGHDDAATENSDSRIEPRPRKKFAGNERTDGSERSERIGEDVKISGTQIEIVVMIMAGVRMGMAVIVFMSEHARARQVHD